MLLRWVNHASFVVEHENVKLICDPWLEGAAFANGWNLLSPTVLAPEQLSEVTHIWYSHEHPDHFTPRALKMIPDQARRRITVLYQAARDGKVLSFCQELGFQVRSLNDGEVVELGRDFRVSCGQVPFYDSWLLVEADGKRLLNLNDCVVNTVEIAEGIRRVAGRPDVLLSQFNDAEWKGNPEQRQLRDAAASEMLNRLKIQAHVFQPTYMVPFASFFYFSHEENFYLNDAKNQIRDVAALIQSACNSQPVVLYPGDTWVVGSGHDPAAACTRYEVDAANTRPIHKAGDSVPLGELISLADSYRVRIKKNNSTLFLWLASNPLAPMLPNVTIHIDDLDADVEFDWRHGLRVVTKEASAGADISMHSESLAFVFQFDWGMDTLTVNGRFRAADAGYRRFIRSFSPGSLNNVGRRFGLGLMADRRFLKRALSIALGKS